MKKKNLLAENMLRFGVKNLNEMTKQNIITLLEQDNQSTVTNITLELDNITAKGNPTLIEYNNTPLWSFPVYKTTQSGKSLGTKAGSSYIYQPIGTNSNYYVIIGNIGTCVETNNNWDISSPVFRALGVIMSQAPEQDSKVGTEGNPVMHKVNTLAGNAAIAIKKLALGADIQQGGMETFLRNNYDAFKTIYTSFKMKYPESPEALIKLAR